MPRVHRFVDLEEAEGRFGLETVVLLQTIDLRLRDRRLLHFVGVEGGETGLPRTAGKLGEAFDARLRASVHFGVDDGLARGADGARESQPQLRMILRSRLLVSQVL